MRILVKGKQLNQSERILPTKVEDLALLDELYEFAASSGFGKRLGNL
jgi:hypothetical protein